MRPFDYTRARTLTDAAQITTDPDTAPIAGGTNLLDLMKLQVETPRQLADINRIGLGEIEDSDSDVGQLADARHPGEVGRGTTRAELHLALQLTARADAEDRVD